MDFLSSPCATRRACRAQVRQRIALGGSSWDGESPFGFEFYDCFSLGFSWEFVSTYSATNGKLEPY